MDKVIQNVNTIQVLKALADEVRLGIVRKLAERPESINGCDVTSCPTVRAMSQPTMSHHFNKLVEAGVVVEEKRGTHKKYALNTELLEAIGIDIYKL